jgi:hypothetical protein
MAAEVGYWEESTRERGRIEPERERRGRTFRGDAGLL